MPFSKKEDLDPIYGERLVGELREIVREPLPERSGPRFKKWNMHELSAAARTGCNPGG
ncbi:MAG TPA: hypothetical protein VN765_13090 [Candidatus Acidoferrum sp.]|nr:hypothetical protein [Candidatus Acidoferrum sp.]